MRTSGSKLDRSCKTSQRITRHAPSRPLFIAGEPIPTSVVLAPEQRRGPRGGGPVSWSGDGGDLFGARGPGMKRLVNVYCDEVRPVPLETDGQNEEWAYIGVLIVAVEFQDDLLRALLNSRCGNPSRRNWGSCAQDYGFHERNNTEVHYKGLNSGPVFSIADRWLNFLLADQSLTWFYILGINFTRLDRARFGCPKGPAAYSRIYNRFFRTAVLRCKRSRNSPL